MRIKLKAAVVEVRGHVVGQGPMDLSVTIRSSGPLEGPDQAWDEFLAVMGRGCEVTVTITDEVIDPAKFRSRLARLAHEDAMDALAEEKGGIGFKALQDQEAERRK